MKWGKKYEENEVISEDILIYIYNDAFDFNYSALADFPNCAIPKCTCYEYGTNDDHQSEGLLRLVHP